MAGAAVTDMTARLAAANKRKAEADAREVPKKPAKMPSMPKGLRRKCENHRYA